MAIADIIVVSILIVLVPKLVERHLACFEFAKGLRITIMLGGVLWIIFSCTHELIYPFIGVTDADANTYEKFWYESTVDIIESGNYGLLIGKMMLKGRWFYILPQYMFYYFTDGTVISVLSINAFMAFWGSLALVRTIYRLAPGFSSARVLLPIFVIFAPSVVFWSSTNLKEALMYWSICQVFAFIVPAKMVKRRIDGFILFIFGAFIGLLLRPHIAIFWLASVLVIKCFDSGFGKFGIILLLLFPLAFVMTSQHGRFDVSSIEANLHQLKGNMRGIISRGEKISWTSSTFDYGPSGPVPIFSGTINISFRPFLWRARNFRSVLATLEIWSISLGILFFWLRMTSREWKSIFLNPGIQAAVLVLILFFFLFAYFPNEGLIARQRVQVFPALLFLLATPIIMRNARLDAEKKYA